MLFTFLEFKIVVYLLYLYSVEILKCIWTELTEDKSALVDFHFTDTPSNYYNKLAVTVEVAVVCSKEFADNFNQDRQTISDYLTAYLWDLSTRFRTLHQSKISFSVTSLTIIKTREEQPFIENVRHPMDGNLNLDAILPLFQKWVSSKFKQLPGFDVAILLLEPLNLNSGTDRGGVADFKGACNFGTIYDKKGETFKSAVVLRGGMMTAAMYEMSILLGATRDQKTRCSHPQYDGRIKGFRKDFQEFFSACTDGQIKDFIKSPQSLCLHTAQGEPIIDPDFDSVLPPSIKEQCRLLSGSKSATAVTTIPGNECALTKCLLHKRGQPSGSRSTDAVLISPLANSRCDSGDRRGGGRCFQGKCLPPGFLLSNVATGKCLLRNQDTLLYATLQFFKLDHCPRSVTPPSERFHMVNVKGGREKLLRIPCQALASTNAYKDNVEKVLFGAKNEFKCMDMCLALLSSGLLGLEECDEKYANQRWEFRDTTSDGEFLLYNVRKEKCVKTSYEIYRNKTLLRVFATKECDKAQPGGLWKLIPVLPEMWKCPLPGPDGDNCFPGPAQLRSQLSLQANSSNTLNLNVSLRNLDGGVSVAPGVIVSWRRRSNFTLMDIPENCFPFPPFHDGNEISLKCKVGRLLQKKNETTLVATLSFNATTTDPITLKGFCATPTMATVLKSDTRKDNQITTCL